MLQAAGQLWALPVLHINVNQGQALDLHKDLCALSSSAVAAVSQWHFPVFRTGTFGHNVFVVLKS